MALRAWFITYFVDREDGWDEWLVVPDFKFAAWQLERAPTTGRLHLHGYVECQRPTRLAALKRILDAPSLNGQARRGTPDQAVVYVTKEETRVAGPWEHGIRSTQGQRVDLDALRQDVLDGHSLQRVANDHFGTFIRYHRGVQAFRGLVCGRRNWPTVPVVLFGGTGTGKSSAARSMAPDAYWVPPASGTGQWWCHYDSEPDLIYDEFYGQLPYALLLRVLDRYPLQLPTKGGSVQFVGRRMIFTSNKAPWHWYKADSVPDQSALRRRLEGCVYEVFPDVVVRREWPIIIFR